MQRIFSTFPRAAPGLALVILRFSVAGQVSADLGLKAVIHPWCLAGTLAIGLLLCVGLATPLLALASALLHAAAFFLGSFADGPVTVFAILDATALALLGPGAYSLDARLFGRRIIIVTTGHVPGEPEP